MALSISVIIPTFNRAHLIRRALDSAVAQAREGDEIIVVDDGSVDDTQSVVSRCDNRVRYVRTANGGAGAARNRGVLEAHGDLVAFLDSDDEWMPGKLDLARSLFAARPEVLFCCSDMAATMPDGTVRHRFLQEWHHDPRSWDDILAPGRPYSSLAPLPPGIDDFRVHIGSLYDPLAGRGYVFTSTVVVRRREAGDALRFATDLPTFEDWVCYGMLARRGACAFLDTETAWEHLHAGPQLTNAAPLTVFTTRLKVLERVWGSDADYLARRGPVYRHLYDAQHLAKIGSMLALGENEAVREELRQPQGARMRRRLVELLPDGLWRSAYLMPSRTQALAARAWRKALRITKGRRGTSAGRPAETRTGEPDPVANVDSTPG